MGMQARRENVKRLTFADRLAIAVGGTALVAGIVVLALNLGTIASIIGASLLGLCGIAFIALLFLLIGESEDRHYQREGTQRPRGAGRAPGSASVPRGRTS